ncbi:MAG: zinc ribbon domain-containing protein [Candidatus Hodarchaeales archaeon]
MNCDKCGNENEKDARFCRHCGEAIAEVAVVKGDKTFVTGKRRTEGGFLCFGEDEEWDNSWNGMIVGVVFISVAIIMALAMLNFFEGFGNAVGSLGFGNAVGSFFGDFGENMGQIGNDIGNFFGNWGENFGESVKNFFGGVEWWNILQPIIVLLFLTIGVILLYRSYREQNR